MYIVWCIIHTTRCHIIEILLCIYYIVNKTIGIHTYM